MTKYLLKTFWDDNYKEVTESQYATAQAMFYKALSTNKGILSSFEGEGVNGKIEEN